MNNDNFTISEELEQMRSQYADLKARLEKQEITNEKLIRESIRKDLRIVNTKVWVSTMAGIIAVTSLPTLSMNLGLRLPFIVISIVWIVSMIAGNIIRNRRLSADRLSGESTRQFLDEVKKRKSVQFRWVRINISLFVLWIGYFIGECIHTGMDRTTLIMIISGAATGALIGLAVGLRMHNRIIGAYEGIILELENPEAAHDIIR